MYGPGYVLLLLAGVLVVFADGQVLLRDGATCLSGKDSDPVRARRIVGFVGIVYHLGMLGLVLVVVPRWPAVSLSPTDLVPKLGLLLLLTGVAHMLAMAVLSRLPAPPPAVAAPPSPTGPPPG